jgi:PBP1b-binding outer membrane lipoprotein LpoB
MRKLITFSLVLFAAIFFVSCARGITTYEAANGKAKCGRYLR